MFPPSPGSRLYEPEARPRLGFDGLRPVEQQGDYTESEVSDLARSCSKIFWNFDSYAEGPVEFL